MSAVQGEVIDLTTTPPPAIIDLSLSDGDTPSASASASEPPPKRKKARRKKARGGEGAARGGAARDIGRPSLLDRLGDGPSDQAARDREDRPSATANGKERRRKRKRTDTGGDKEGSTNRDRDRDALGRDGPASADALFFEDTQRAEIPTPGRPGSSKGAHTTTTDSNGTDVTKEDAPGAPALLLPAHVSVLGGQDGAEPIEILAPSPEDDDSASYIEYLDYDDDRRVGLVRYFEEPTEDGKAARVVCKHCGAEGAHKTYECPVLICLTCGARDEHSTRSCPISKTCFTCGMKGHINMTCPNRHTARGMGNVYNDCDRCGARTHKENECPTLWRMYEYVADGERQAILGARAQKRTLGLGRGGEGYIATDEWCYNCGRSGHLGDDCRTVPHNGELREPSAFGAYNTFSGPFSAEAEVHAEPRPPREWEAGGAFADGYGARVPTDVGRQGRRRERQRLEKRERDAEEAEDEEDWFGSRRRERSSASGQGQSQSQSQGRRMEISLKGGGGRGGQGSGRRNGGGGGGGGGSLLARLDHTDLPMPTRETDSIQIRGASRRHDEWDRDRHRERNGGESGGRPHRDDRREDWRGRRDPGPRYRGGYR